MNKLSITVILFMVCSTIVLAQTANTAGKATLMSNATIITDLTTGEVKGVTKGTVGIQSPENVDLINSGTQEPTLLQNITPVNSIINSPGGIISTAQTSSGSVQRIATPNGSLNGTAGGNIINVNNLPPTGTGSGLSRDINHINTPPVNTNGQVVSPQ